MFLFKVDSHWAQDRPQVLDPPTHTQTQREQCNWISNYCAWSSHYLCGCAVAYISSRITSGSSFPWSTCLTWLPLCTKTFSVEVTHLPHKAAFLWKCLFFFIDVFIWLTPVVYFLQKTSRTFQTTANLFSCVFYKGFHEKWAVCGCYEWLNKHLQLCNYMETPKKWWWFLYGLLKG